MIEKESTAGTRRLYGTFRKQTGYLGLAHKQLHILARESVSIMNRFLFAKHAEDRAPSGCCPQARWLCCSLLTYRTGYASSLAPRQRAWGPAAECELISARTLSGWWDLPADLTSVSACHAAP